MWKNYFKTALRTLKNQRFYTINNALGLTLGFLSSFFILQYTQFERQFDKHVPHRDLKARLVIDKYRGGEQIISSAETYVGCGPVLYEQLPEINAYTRTFNMAVRMNSVISHQPIGEPPIHLKLKDYYFADSMFIKFFGYDLVHGNPQTALARPNTAVITESLATTYFGDANPMGKVLVYQDEELQRDEYVITGLMKDPPVNTHLPFSLLLSYNTFDNRKYPGNYKTSWKARKAYTYFAFDSLANLEAVEAKLPAIIAVNKDIGDGNKEILSLQRFSDIHFTKGLSGEPVPTTDRKLLQLLDVIAVLILAIACINFINLSTTFLLKRAKEVCVRKVLGAARSQLIAQYYIQCGVINFFAWSLAIIILYIGWPYLNQVADTSIPIDSLTSYPFIVLAVTMLVLIIIISGLVPALILSSFAPIDVLSGGLKAGGRKWPRMVLLTGQFTISFCLIMATLIVYKQLQFMQNQTLGFGMENVLIVRVPGILPMAERPEISGAYNQFMTIARQHSSIVNASASLTIPGHARAFRTATHQRNRPDEEVTLRFNGSGASFIKTYNMELIAGRNFKPDVQYDIDSAIILSAAAVEALNYENPQMAIGTMVQVPTFRLTCEVVGVVADYRLSSAKSTVEPMAMLCYEPAYTNFFSFKLQGGSLQASIKHIDKAWSTTFPGNPMDYFFLDDFFNKQYKKEKRLSKLFAAFGTVAIVLAAMGLAGLSAQTAQQKTKEIGIRKALGSSSFQIFTNLSYQFVVLVLISSILGIPIILYLSQKWLAQFPQQVPTPLWLYMLPVILLLVVTMVAISYQTVKAAITNPVESLRYE